MVLEKLSDSLKETLRKIVKAGTIDKKTVDALVGDIKKALISADVNIKLGNEICNSIKKRSLEEKPPSGLTSREFVVNIVYEELTKFLGGMLVGLFGSGKTTNAAKLAKYYKKRGKKVVLIQTDTWRPAAYEQLKQQAEKVKVPFYGVKDEKDPVKIYKKYEKDLPRFDVAIIDTAGRDALNKELIKEIEKLHKTINADEKILVISGDIGQAAQKQAETFHKSVGVTGVIVTKLDGTAKGGGALTACSTTKAKVKFIGVGEKIDDLEEFKPKNFVSRLLGMGDLETLLEKAEQAIDKDKAEKIGKKVIKGEFNLQDLYEQMEAMSKMGPLSQIANMIPGMSGAIPKELMGQQETKLKSWKIAMDSMTPEEKEHPDLLNPSRVERIAKGSGRPIADVRELIKQYKQMKKMMKTMGDPRKLKQLQKMMGKGGMPNIPGLKL
jgi:signal recognition particle subunit SRP54